MVNLSATSTSLRPRRSNAYVGHTDEILNNSRSALPASRPERKRIVLTPLRRGVNASEDFVTSFKLPPTTHPCASPHRDINTLSPIVTALSHPSHNPTTPTPKQPSPRHPPNHIPIHAPTIPPTDLTPRVRQSPWILAAIESRIAQRWMEEDLGVVARLDAWARVEFLEEFLVET